MSLTRKQMQEIVAFDMKRRTGLDFDGRRYGSITGAKAPQVSALWELCHGSEVFKGKDKPVENVSWEDCKKFLEKLNALPEVKAAGWTYRLPTEAEWRHSCRAGAIGEYCRLPDGTEITGESIGKVAWYVDNSHDETHAVGQKAPNAFGLYGMHGNVWEWCEDLYDAGHAHRVCLGGSWNCNALRCTASRRRGEVPGSRGNHLGFRLAASRAF